MFDPGKVRPVTASEMPQFLEIAQAVQDKLTRGGSAQQIAGYSVRNIRARIERGEMFALEVSGGLIGSAFVEPAVPERFPQIAAWNAVPDGCPAWFLYGLVIHPQYQGQGWGRALLDGLCRQEKLASPAVLLLDCWAGNAKLRRFYADAGFELHGVFPEADFQVAVFQRNLSARGACFTDKSTEETES